MSLSQGCQRHPKPGNLGVAAPPGNSLTWEADDNTSDVLELPILCLDSARYTCSLAVSPADLRGTGYCHTGLHVSEKGRLFHMTMLNNYDEIMKC